jgi:CheY-like chemotaxis protein
LSLEGFNVVYRVDGESGLETAKTLIPDGIVLDIALPGMDGWEVLDHLRRNPKTQHIPVLVATAHDTSQMRTKAQSAMADAFIGKPFDLTHLRAAVAHLVDHHEAPAG